MKDNDWPAAVVTIALIAMVGYVSVVLNTPQIILTIVGIAAFLFLVKML